MTIRCCFCTIAFRTEAIEEILPRLAKIGYDGVEIWGNHVEGKTDDELLALKAIADEHQISIEVLSPYWWLTNSTELLQETKERAKRFVHYACLLDCPKIRTFTDSGPTGIGSDVATDGHWQTAVDALQSICDYAPDILFTVERHTKTLADTLDSAEQLLQRVDRDNLKLIYHLPNTENDMLGEFDRAQPHVRHIHCQNTGDDTQPGFVEVGNADLPGFFQHIHAQGYSHSLSVEYCFKGATWDRAQSAYDYLKAHMPSGALAT